MTINNLTQERLKAVIHYDATTGIFRWRYSVANRVKPWDVAGVTDADGYHRIRINGRAYLSHRLAWLYVYGSFPSIGLDHMNRNKQDNRINNLREATKAENAQNVSKRKDNTSGLVGVHFHKANRKWIAYISVNKQRKHLGVFDSAEDAHEAYAKAKLQLHTFNPEVVE